MNCLACCKITRSLWLSVHSEIVKAVPIICALTSHFECTGGPPSISYCAPIYTIDTGHRLSNREYILVSCCVGINHHLRLPVCYSINHKCNPVSLPDDVGSRSTSGNAGEGVDGIIKCQAGYSGCTCT